MPKKHPNKDVRKAVAYALECGWSLEPVRGHAWGVLYCREKTGEPGFERCRRFVWSTPRDPDRHARDIRKAVDACSHP